MSTHIYETANAVSAAVAALGTDNRLKAIATCREDGTYELVVPDGLDATLNDLDIVDAHLSALKQQRIAALTVSCSDEIVGGYTSSALGSAHTYPSKTTDQINMMGSVSASLLPGLPNDWSTPFWCADSDGVWAFRMHSVTQIQTAGADGKAHVVLCQSTLERLTSTVMAATTAEAIAEVIWSSP